MALDEHAGILYLTEFDGSVVGIPVAPEREHGLHQRVAFEKTTCNR